MGPGQPRATAGSRAGVPATALPGAFAAVTGGHARVISRQIPRGKLQCAMAKSRLITIPFALGIDEQTAPRELEPRALRKAVNVRQRQLKAFGMRADYLAQTMTEIAGGTLVPYDMLSLNGRLFALGDRQGRGVPTDISEFISQPGGAWRGTLPAGATGTRVPPITRLRNVGQTPDVSSQIQTARVAAVNGLVCLVYGFGQTAGGATSHVHIFRAANDSTVLLTTVAASNARVVVAGNSFWVLGVNASDDLVGFRFDTLSASALAGATTLYTGTVTNSIFDACSVAATSQTQFAVFLRDAATTVVRRFNESGVQQQTFAGPAVAADTLAVEADSNANQIVVATRVGTADVNLTTYNLTTAAVVAGPTAAFGQAVDGRLSLTRSALGSTSGDVVSDDGGTVVRRFRFTTTTLAGSVLNAHNYKSGGQGVASTLGCVMPVISGDRNNQLIVYDQLITTGVYAAAQIDELIAHPLTFGANKGGQCCVDATTGRFYWARLLEGTDGQQIAAVSEFALGSTERRQTCQVGNAMLITGAMPLSFDTRQVVESGFLEKPVMTLTPNTGTGALIPEAEYDYIAIYQWIDAQGRQARSRLSDIQTVTLSAANNEVIGTVFAPHTLRKDSNSGSTPVISLYRTEAVATLSPAIVTGSAGINPPSGVLNGLTLRIIAAGTLFVVTFSAAATTQAQILAEVNAVTGATVTATSAGGALKLTTSATGAAVSIIVQRVGTANTILGFSTSVDTFGNGDAVYTKGSVFHLCSTTVVPISGEFGAAVAVVDTLSDTTLLTQEPLYTQGENGALTGILEREAPPPCRFACAVGARAFLGGLPDPSEVAISFETAPAETLAFSSEFAFRAWVDGDVTAVGSLDGTPVAFTQYDIFRFPNAFPNDQGVDGELGPAVRIPSDGGCNNPHSIVETSLGLFYLSTSGKLMLLPRGGGAPVWIGQHIHETLLSFPDITSASYIDEDFCALFTCRNSGGTATVFLVYDLRVNQWYRDEFASAQVVRAGVDYLGRLAYIDNATVRLQSASLTPSTFIPYNPMTGSLAPFEGEGAGHGELIMIELDGEFRGNCTLTARISYDDGVTFTTLVVKTFATPTFVVGQSFVVQWYPRVRKGSAFVLDFAVTALAGAASPGLILNTYTIEVKEASPIKRQRTTAAQRG